MRRLYCRRYLSACLLLGTTFFIKLTAAQQIAFSPSSLNFGSLSSGSSETLTVQITNIAPYKIGVTQESVSGMGYTVSGMVCPVILKSGQKAWFNVTFSPPSAGRDSGIVSLVTEAWGGGAKYRGLPSTVGLALSGSGIGSGQIGASPGSVTFGSVMVGSSQTLPAAVMNSGTANVTISQAAISNAAYTVSGLNPPVTLTAGQSLTFNLNFAPAVAGSTSGNLTISSDAANGPLNVALSGSGTAPGQLTLSPSAYNFGSINTGTSATMTGSLTATGSAITISSASSSSSEFVVNGIGFPVTLANGQSIAFTVTFLPQTSGTASGSISFASNATNTPATEAVTGTGLPPVSHSVSLSWNASTGSGVVGYEVYRGTASGGPYAQVTTSPDPALTFSDTTVTAGQTYYYVATAVDGNGSESGYSNETTAVIPNP